MKQPTCANPVVDLIVPAYKESPYLFECLKSLQEQDFTRTRVLIVTSTPSDFLRRTAEAFDLELKVSPRPSGIASDWNFALESAQAPFVTICHQDDVYQPGYCTAMVGAFQQFDDTLIAICNNTEHTSSGPRDLHTNLRIKRLLLGRAFRGASVLSAHRVRRPMLAYGNPVCCPGVMFNRKHLAEFRFVDSMRSNLDWDAWDRICSMNGHIAYVRDAVVSHRVHEQSETTASIAGNVRVTEDMLMFGRYWPQLVCRMLMSVYKLGYAGNAVAPAA